MAEIIYKKVGETPLEALQRFRLNRPDLASEPLTYAGRLDPMAHGELLILIGRECKARTEMQGFDKEYEIEIVFGLKTDTYDGLGIVIGVDEQAPGQIALEKFIGRFNQPYPPFSSKTVKGKQLHILARAGMLPEEMPQKSVEIYSIDKLGARKISAGELLHEICSRIDKVKGEFRQDAIKRKWSDVLASGRGRFECLSLRVTCSSGTYMRSLAHRLGEAAGTGAFALSIRRTKIFTDPSS